MSHESQMEQAPSAPAKRSRSRKWLMILLGVVLPIVLSLFFGVLLIFRTGEKVDSDAIIFLMPIAGLGGFTIAPIVGVIASGALLLYWRSSLGLGEKRDFMDILRTWLLLSSVPAMIVIVAAVVGHLGAMMKFIFGIK